MLSQAELLDELSAAANMTAQIERLLDFHTAFLDEFGRTVTPLLPLLEAMAATGNTHAERLVALWNRWDADFQRAPF